MLRSFFIGYFYYRLYQLDGTTANRGVRGAFAIAVACMLSVLGVVIIINTLFFDDTPHLAPETGKGIALAGGLAGVMLGMFFQSRCSSLIEFYKQKWDNEDSKVRIRRGFIVAIFLIIPLLPLLVITEF
jgi:hypothetical protein